MKPQFFFPGITLKHFNKKKSQLFTKMYVHSCEDELSIALERGIPDWKLILGE